MILNKICNSIGNNVAPKKFEQLHGINPRLSYNKANFFYLPRFSTPEMIEARKMNKIALRDIDCFYDKSFKNNVCNNKFLFVYLIVLAVL